MENPTLIFSVVGGVVIGAVVTWLIFRSRGESEKAILRERLQGREQQIRN